MAFSLDGFAALRPFLFHLTAFDNLERVRRTGELESAAALIARADRPELLGERRRSGERILVDGPRCTSGIRRRCTPATSRFHRAGRSRTW